METPEIIRMLRQCANCCLPSCESCPEYHCGDSGEDRQGFMWNCGALLLEAAERLESQSRLMEDIRKDMWDRTNENHRLKRELKALRDKLGAVEVERDDLRKDIEVLTEELTAQRESGDLISRSALLEEYEWLKSVVNPCSVSEVEEHMERIRNAPAVEAEPWNPVTNHQRIARMSVPEMAKWLWSMKALCDCCEKQYICGVPDDEVTKGYCLKYVEKWLEQEVANDV